jgi:4-hydroxy 2-oxovalerate aldolase
MLTVLLFMKKSKLKKNNLPIIIDCTLRDGGYYNSWDFPTEIVDDYLIAMKAANINFVEIGFRFLNNSGYKGPFAFSTDKFIKNLKIPKDLKLGVMVNASDLYTDIGWKKAILKLFPESANNTPIKLIRFACHFHEIPNALLAAKWLSKRGYLIGLNLMQITDRSKNEIIQFSKSVSGFPIEVVYFADSMGSMKQQNIAPLVNMIRKHWKGNIGIHTHDNMGLALANTLEAYSKGVNWLDATVTGMGRGPGNTKTEELVIELNKTENDQIDIIPLLSIIRNYFDPLKRKKKWGINPYYYLSGKYGIHPTFIQVMMNDSRYSEKDIISAIEYLKKKGGKKFKHTDLDIALQFYNKKSEGKWSPKSLLNKRDILILGSGPSIDLHKKPLENFIKEKKPIVLALNLKKGIDKSLINFYIACHPVKLLSDAENHSVLPQPLITPASTFSKNLLKKLANKKIHDYGIKISSNIFKFYDKHCVIPNSLVISYALAICVSGNASNIFMAGFDGYKAGDARNDEVENIFNNFYDSGVKKKIISITPSVYKGLISKSLYGL